MSNDALIYHPNIALKGISIPKDLDSADNDFIAQHGEEIMSEDMDSFLLDFLKNGRNIFHLEPELISLFKKTSVEDVVVEDVITPFESFYIHIGREANVYAPKYEQSHDVPFDKSRLSESVVPIVGIYVSYAFDSRDNACEGLDFMFVPEFGQPTEYAYFSLLWCYHSKGFRNVSGEKTTIKQALHNNVYQNPFDNKQAEIDYKERIFPDGKDFFETRGSWTPNIEDLIWKETVRELTNLAVNTILFLTSADSDVEEGYPSTYPEKLVNKARSGNAKEVKRAESKLASQGYTKIKFVGRSVKKYFQASNTGTTVSTHWRRGHWRKQPFGAKTEGNKRLVWIKPTIVNKGLNAEKPMNGHIYEV